MSDKRHSVKYRGNVEKDPALGTRVQATENMGAMASTHIAIDDAA